MEISIGLDRISLSLCELASRDSCLSSNFHFLTNVFTIVNLWKMGDVVAK